MCIAAPMQVVRAEPGRAWVAGRGQVSRVDTALVGDCACGDWLLVFLDTARERIDAARAAEVNAVLDLLQSALDGSGEGSCGGAIDVGFELPSRIDAAALAGLSGRHPCASGSDPSPPREAMP